MNSSYNNSTAYANASLTDGYVFDPIYSYFSLIPSLISTLLSIYSLVYAIRNAHHIPENVMRNWIYKIAYYLAPLSYLFSFSIFIPYTIYIFIPNPSPQSGIAVNVLYSISTPALHVSIGCYCVMCLQRYLWLSELLSFNKFYLLPPFILTVVVFVGEALVLSPWYIYEYTVPDENYDLITLFVYLIGKKKSHQIFITAYAPPSFPHHLDSEPAELCLLTVLDTVLCFTVFYFFGVKYRWRDDKTGEFIQSSDHHQSQLSGNNNNNNNDRYIQSRSRFGLGRVVSATRAEQPDPQPGLTQNEAMVRMTRRFLIPCLVCSILSSGFSIAASTFDNVSQDVFGPVSEIGYLFTAIHFLMFQHFIINLKILAAWSRGRTEAGVALLIRGRERGNTISPPGPPRRINNAFKSSAAEIESWTS